MIVILLHTGLTFPRHLMTEWFNVKDVPMPKDREIIAMWKGRRGIAQYDEDKPCWCFCYGPAEMSFTHGGELNDTAALKFSYWCELPEFPQEWLDL